MVAPPHPRVFGRVLGRVLVLLRTPCRRRHRTPRDRFFPRRWFRANAGRRRASHRAVLQRRGRRAPSHRSHACHHGRRTRRQRCTGGRAALRDWQRRFRLRSCGEGWRADDGTGIRRQRMQTGRCGAGRMDARVGDRAATLLRSGASSAAAQPQQHRCTRGWHWTGRVSG